MAMTKNINDIMQKIPDKVQPEWLSDMNATVQLHLTGQYPGSWVWTFKNGTIQSRLGVIENPRLTISIGSEDFADILYQKTNPIVAFSQGKMQVHGDLGLAMQMVKAFRQAMQ
jgi:putative sterol carrier protein